MSRRKETNNRNSGSAIIEYTIVFPLILLIIFALFYAGFIMHQRSVLDSAVNRATIYAARLLSDPQYKTIVSSAGPEGDALDCESNSYTMEESFEIQPYRYLTNFNGGNAEEPVKQKVQSIVQANSFWGGTSNLDVTYSYTNYVLYQQITISAKQEFPLPGMFKLVGLDDKIEISSVSVQAVTDPDEFIRNVDFTIDIIERITQSNVVESIQQVTGKIAKFADVLFGGNKE